MFNEGPSPRAFGLRAFLSVVRNSIIPCSAFDIQFKLNIEHPTPNNQ